MKSQLSILIFSLLFFFNSASLFAQEPQALWVAGFGSSILDISVGAGTDSIGNVYYAGSRGAGIDFDPGPGTFTVSQNGFFISKLDSMGNLVWVKTFGTTAGGFPSGDLKDLVVDKEGNLYLLGVMDINALDFDPGPGIAMLLPFPNMVFVAKYDQQGNLVWAKNFAGEGFPRSIALDVFGNILVSGSFVGFADFDPGNGVFNLASSSATSNSAFICKLDSGGNFIWAGNFTAPSSWSDGYGVCSDLQGNMFLTGRFYGAPDFDPGPTSFTAQAQGTVDLFILKLDMQGNFDWVKILSGNTTYNVARQIGTDNFGDVYAVGQFSGTVDFDPGVATYSLTNTGPNYNDLYIVKLSSQGTFRWAKNMAGAFPYKITKYPDGDLLLPGYYFGTTDLDLGIGNSNNVSAGDADAFILKFDTAGNTVWAKAYGGTRNDDCKTLTFDKNGNMYGNGIFNRTINFQPSSSDFTLTVVGFHADIYVSKYGKCFTPTAPLDITPSINKIICENNKGVLTVNTNYKTKWYTSSTNGALLYSGLSFTTPPLSAGTHTFYAEAFTCTNSISRGAVTVSVDACVGIGDKTDNEEIQVFPNPTSQFVHIRAKTISQLQIFNALNQVVVSYNLSGSEVTLDISELPNGLYIIWLETEENKILKVKLVKEANK